MGVIYKITNKISGKIYVGKRQIAPYLFLSSNYYGSGRGIRDAIKSYGIDSFTREIIDTTENNTIARKKEIENVDKEILCHSK